MYVHLFAQYPVPTFDWYHVAQATMDMLPDVALLEIFDFYVYQGPWMTAWHTLVHVCRKWRNVVFGSPRRLDLRLWCNANTPVRERLDVWPHLPIAIVGSGRGKWGVDNFIAALKHNDRICHIHIWSVSSLQIEKALAAMQQPFPALTHLTLEGGTGAVIPASFLGGSAPALQELFLGFISFSGLPRLLLSATHLIHLELWDVPHSGYISPEAMVTCVSALTRLETLHIGFKSPQSFPDRRSQRLPPSTRTLLPILTELSFSGVCEYLEDLVSRIDAPVLDNLKITFFHRLIFNTPRLIHFITHSPKFKTTQYEAHVTFFDWGVSVTFSTTFEGGTYGILTLGVSCRQSDWQLSSLAQVCSSSFPQALIAVVEKLHIGESFFRLLLPQWQDDIESSQWLEVLNPFTAVKDLYISLEFTPRIAPALQELVGESTTEVLPIMQRLFLEETLLSGPSQEAIRQFVAARQISSHPITVSHWERKV